MLFQDLVQGERVVAQRVEFGRHDVGRRNVSREICLEHVEVRAFAIALDIGQVRFEIVLPVGVGQPVPRASQQAMRSRIPQAISAVVKQQAADIRGIATLVTQVQMRCQAQVRPARIAREAYVIAIDTILGATHMQVFRHRRACIQGGGILRLGGQRVIHAHHHGLRVVRQEAGDAVVRVGIAQYPTSAMDVHDGRRQIVDALRVIQAHGHVRAIGNGKHHVFGTLHQRTALVPERALLHVVGSQLVEPGVGVESITGQFGGFLDDGAHLVRDFRHNVYLVCFHAFHPVS